MVKVEGEKIKGIFVNRPNRFEADVLIDGRLEKAHVPNTGRMKEMLHEGVEVTLIKSDNPNRKTGYSMMFVNKNGHLVCINSILANRVFEDAVKEGKIRGLNGHIRREVSFRNSRIDFFIEGEEKTFVEVKCATYEENGITMFPDAPTERGRKHIGELMHALEDGYKASIVIVAFMDYVTEFTPNYKIDKEFGIMLKEAYDRGVDVRAYKCSISEDVIGIMEEIKVYF